MPNGACDAVISDFSIQNYSNSFNRFMAQRKVNYQRGLVLFKMKQVSVKRQWKKSAWYQCNSVNSNLVLGQDTNIEYRT